MIFTAVTDAFKLGLLRDMSQDVFRMALYTDKANLGPETPTYTPNGEVIGPGYQAGGIVLAGYRVTLETFVEKDVQRVVAIADWDDPVWPNATITARAVMIYNFTRGNRTVAVLDLGQNYTSTNGAFTVTLPEPTGQTALFQVG
jgi:hypothetical protein